MFANPFTVLLRISAFLLAITLPVSGCSKGTESQSEIPLQSSSTVATLPAGHPSLPTATEQAAPAGSTAARSVKVRVQLSPALRDKTAPGDALYIFARASQGPAMPLAIVRKQVKDLPVTITLDDSMAMMPDLRMSAFPELVFGARVSKSGDAIAKPGDLEGYSHPTRSDKADVLIASVVGTQAKPTAGAPHAGDAPAAFQHSASGAKSRLNIPADVKAKWKSAELSLIGQDGVARTVKVAVGGEMKLENGLVLQVLAYVPAFQSDTGTVTSASNAPDNPAVLLQLLDKQQVKSEGWVFQKLPDFDTFSSDRLKVRLLGASG